jgi:DNA adenine methylase
MRSPIPWMGSKRRLARRLLPMFPPHTCYCELFAGSGAVLFARPEPAEVEVLNDTDLDLITLFRVLQHHLEEFVRHFKWALVSRQLFDWLKETPPETLTDIQRAARFYYLQRLSFGAKSVSRSFGTTTTTAPRINLLRIEEDLSAIHARLAGVCVEHLDWTVCLAKYDRRHTLFLADPPYLNTAGYSTGTMSLDGYRTLKERLEAIRGKAILTVNDHPQLRALFSAWTREEVALRYTVGGGAGRVARELILRTW